MVRSDNKITSLAQAVRRVLAVAAATSLALVGLVTSAHAFLPLHYVDEDQNLASYDGEYKYLDEQTQGGNLSGWYFCRTVTDIGPLSISNHTTILMGPSCRLTAEGASEHQPGIRVNPTASLTIYGQLPQQEGKLIARGGPSAPGIGHAAPSDGTGTLPRSGDITIAGGHITAQGGHYGAGIGNSHGMEGGTITISGGTVRATGGEFGAGIGGGYQSGGGNVLIRHGMVSARGGLSSPGIGAPGDHYGAMSVTITGSATVTANGNGQGPGIGVTDHSPSQRGLPDIDIATRGVVQAKPGADSNVRVGITRSGPSGASLETVNQDTRWLVQTTAEGQGTLLPDDISSPPGNPDTLNPDAPVHFTFGYPVEHGALTVLSSPETGHHGMSLTLDGEGTTNINSHTFSPLSGHHHLKATFGEIITAAEVDLSLEAPAVGIELPTTAITAGGHAVESLSWSPDHVHAAGAVSYTAHVTIAPALGYEFDASTVVTFNDQTATTTQLEADGTLTVTYDFPATDALIDNVELHIDSPVFDEELPTAATTTDTRYTVGALTWTPADSTATSATEYTASVTLAPHTGQLFTGSTSASVNDQSADVHLEDDGSLTVTYTFPATDTWIETAELELEAPMLGKTLAETATTTDTHYSAGEVTWTPAQSPASPATEYTATVVLTPDAGYVFDDSTTASINSQTATATFEADGTLTVTYGFPATDRDSVGLVLTGLDTEYTYGDAPFTVSPTATPNNAPGGGVAPMGGAAPMSFTPSSFGPAALIPVTFTSSDPTVATVTDNGDNTATVTILRAGTFRLSATTEPTSTLHGTRVNTEITILESTPSVTATEVDGTIHVSVIGVGATPAGTVSVYVGTNVLAANVPLIDGAATVALDGLPAGESTLIIRFDGDAGFYAATEADQLSVTIAAEQMATGNEDGSEAEGEGLPVTGGTAQYGLIAVAVVLLFLGTTLAIIRLRRTSETNLA